MSRRTRVAGVASHIATIARDIGSLLLMQATMMTASAVVALAFREWYLALAFLISGGVTAAAGWFTTALFGSLPFLLSAYLTPADVMSTFVPASAD